MSPAYQKALRENFDAPIRVRQISCGQPGGQGGGRVRRKEVRADAAAREAVGTEQLVVAQKSRDVDRREENRWAQLKDKPLVTGLAYAIAVGTATGLCRHHRRAGTQPL